MSSKARSFCFAALLSVDDLSVPAHTSGSSWFNPPELSFDELYDFMEAFTWTIMTQQRKVMAISKLKAQLRGEPALTRSGSPSQSEALEAVC